MKTLHLSAMRRGGLAWLMTGLVSLMATFSERPSAGSAWERLVLDEHTVALYRFDEGEGNEARSACGDPTLTLRAKAAQWGEHPGGGAVARFERREDDATIFVGPKNHDKLHLRTCTEAWTVEAWVRYTGEGGRGWAGRTWGQICGNDDEGYGLDGIRGGWIFYLYASAQTRQLGLAPCARFMGDFRGRDPNHDTSSYINPSYHAERMTWHATPRGDGFIRDTEWHHVAWQFRYADQTHYLFIDGRLIYSMQLPPVPGGVRDLVNDSRNVGVPFTVGGFVHSQDPPYFLAHGNFEGEIADLRISSVMRHPVVDQLSIVKRRGPAVDQLRLVAAAGLPFETAFTTDGADGPVGWALVEGELPDGLSLDTASGVVSGCPSSVGEPRKVTLQATDASGASDRHTVVFEVRPGRISTISLPPGFAGRVYDVPLESEHFEAPLRWELADGVLPEGLRIDADGGSILGTPAAPAAATFRVRVTDARGMDAEQVLSLSVLPAELAALAPDEHTVFLYDWQGEKARLIHDVMGDDALALDWTNMGGDRRVEWPGRAGRFPQEPGYGEFGFVSLTKNHDKHNLRTCTEAWTVEAWVRRGGRLRGFAETYPRLNAMRFDFGHVCGTYDNTKRGVWELYLSDHDSPDGSMAPGVHFLGVELEQALMDLHPWKRAEGIVGDPAGAGIRDTEWHHVAWQYNYAEDLHQLFLDGRLIWQMRSPDGRRLVNNRQHDAQFSVFARINGYVLRGHDEHGTPHVAGRFNYRGFGNFFGQIGEIRVSNVLRY